jgi:hypothetical protein
MDEVVRALRSIDRAKREMRRTTRRFADLRVSMQKAGRSMRTAFASFEQLAFADLGGEGEA